MARQGSDRASGPAYHNVRDRHGRFIRKKTVRFRSPLGGPHKARNLTQGRRVRDGAKKTHSSQAQDDESPSRSPTPEARSGPMHRNRVIRSSALSTRSMSGVRAVQFAGAPANTVAGPSRSTHANATPGPSKNATITSTARDDPRPASLTKSMSRLSVSPRQSDEPEDYIMVSDTEEDIKPPIDRLIATHARGEIGDDDLREKFNDLLALRTNLLGAHMPAERLPSELSDESMEKLANAATRRILNV
ncbi:hypothetical protein PENSPDRAFT_735010 [Peniophora sp. CONT]|nr:hypothetical protein PENSPDRAFT_735010 [Peniophora sp. CONT]